MAGIIAKLHPTDFGASDSNFNSLTILGGYLYYTLCSHNIDTYGRVYRYNLATEAIELLADLGEITGEAGRKSIPQGKSHSPFYQIGDDIYFATHVSYYAKGEDGRESPNAVPEGYSPYPGGKFIAYNTKTGQFKILFSLPAGEGIITMQTDEQRGIAYCLSWPSGLFYVYDINADKLYDRGRHCRGGEIGAGDEYSCITRFFAIDPRDGAAFFTNSDGDIMEYRRETGETAVIGWAHMKKDVFGRLDPRRGGHYGYNWRHILWNDKRQTFYGVHGKSGYLFTFDPKHKKMEVLTRIASEHCIRNGINEDFRYGYMTLAQKDGDPDTLYYISGYYTFNDPTPEQARLMQQSGDPADAVSGKDALHYLTLVTYHIPTGAYADHGVIRTEDGRCPVNTQSIAVAKDGRIFTCPWLINPEPAVRPFGCQLISFTI